MNKVLLVSPHFDDAILSAGQFMAGRPDCTVLTVFGGAPKDPLLVSTSYDMKCGFDNANDAIVVRRSEDKNATGLLSADSIHLDFTDSQYGNEYSIEEIAKSILSIVKKDDYEMILAPLGIGHPDHKLVSNAVIEAATAIPTYLWEDLPLRVVEPHLVIERINYINASYSVDIDYTNTASIGTGPMEDKIRALLCYKSQIGTGILDPHIIYVPERFYKI